METLLAILITLLLLWLVSDRKSPKLTDREKREDLLRKYLKRPAQSSGEGLQQELKNELKTQAVDQRQITKAPKK